MSGTSRPSIVRTFMTHEMSDADIVAVSTGREAEFGRIMAAIRRSRIAAPGPLQHVVLYGSRGFGKSFMMRRLEIALGEEPPGGEPVLFLLLPEEQHNLQKSPHAFLDFITALLPRDDDDAAFAEAMFQWPKPGEAARRWADSAARLDEALDTALPGGKGLAIVAVENFDTLLSTLFSEGEDEQRLRDWLFRPKNRVMLLATATGTVDMDYDRPLFQAFEPVRLTPWTNDDCISYFNRKRESEGKPPLDARQEAKARAVAEFIGGTPRLAQLLADVIETEDALSVAATMDALADRLAEYYKRRIEDLAPLVRGLLDALIRGGEPASQTQLAERVGAEGQSQIARAMTDLQRADIIRGRPALDSRETLYSVTDRVFAHYYRLRQGGRTAGATPLAAILDFLRSFYSREEQKAHGLRHLLDGRPAEGALLSRMAMEGVETGGHHFYVKGFEKRLRVSLSAATAGFGDIGTLAARLADEPERVLQECREASGSPPVDAAIRATLCAQALFRLGHTDKAQEELEIAATAASLDQAALVVCLVELLTFLSGVRNRNLQAATLGVSLQATDLRTLSPPLACRAHRMVGWSLGQFGRHAEALETQAQAAELARQAGDKGLEAACLSHAGWSLGQLGRHAEALETLAQAAELARQAGDSDAEAERHSHAGWSLGKLGRHAEALETLTQAVELARQAGDKGEEAVFLRQAGWSLGELGRHAEALETLALAAELARNVGDKDGEAVCLNLAGSSLGQLGRHAEALETLTRAAELARESRDDYHLCWAIRTALDSAAHVLMRGIGVLFAEWVRSFQEKQDLSLPDPRRMLMDFLTAAMRAGELESFDAVIAEHGEWLTSESPMFVYHRHGEALADMAAKGGRAAGWEAAAGLLPRVARLQALAHEDLRDRTWLSDLVSGFAEKCRDPGLLRDVAALLTPDLSPEAEASAVLLTDLALVDEADEPERVLARLDPDRALLIRRLRGLPDPEPLRPAKSGRPKRR